MDFYDFYRAQEFLDLVFKAKSSDSAIDDVLAFAGRNMGVSRCYIFESISESLTSNTYEWCADGVEPMITYLKELPKEIYSYNELMAGGLTATDDIRLLKPNDRSVLMPQGIKALAVVPIFFNNEPLGYVGFDDCVDCRKWSPGEIQFLQSLSDILASLIVRRNNERQINYGLKTLRTVLDNFDNLIFVTSIHTNKLLFANTAFAQSVGSTTEKLVGQFTTSVLRSWASNASDHDPLSELIGADGLQKKESIVWEFHNQSNDRWYQFHDSIIKWTDGNDVLLENATEITARKKYEDQLKRDASTDSMTGLYLRERGRQIIQQILDKPSDNTESNCLVFIDLDDLKNTNDRYGHAAGDRQIMKSIELILSNIRRSDTLCRWGGDEFVLIVRADQSQADRVMEKIQKQISTYNEQKLECFELGLSYGIVEIVPGTGSTVDGLIAEADNKMYINKTASTGRHAH